MDTAITIIIAMLDHLHRALKAVGQNWACVIIDDVVHRVYTVQEHAERLLSEVEDLRNENHQLKDAVKEELFDIFLSLDEDAPARKIQLIKVVREHLQEYGGSTIGLLAAKESIEEVMLATTCGGNRARYVGQGTKQQAKAFNKALQGLFEEFHFDVELRYEL